MKKRPPVTPLLLFCVPLFAAQSPSIGNLRVFPADNPWNWDISRHQIHPNSANYIASIGATTGLHPDFGTVWNGAPIGIPYAVVGRNQPLIPVTYTAYGSESDPGPFPIPLDAPIEGGPSSTGDRHAIAVDTGNGMLYELFRAFPQTDRWNAESGAKFDLKTNNPRPQGWTSADAAGLPIFPGLVRYEEVYIKGEITHALRFTVQNSQRAYIWPARHFASSSTDPNRPPMGLRVRLKAGYDISRFSEPVRVILRALKKHGMIVADNGSNWYVSGAPDDRWDDDILRELATVKGGDFEVVRTVDDGGNPIYPAATVHRSTGRRDSGPSGRVVVRSAAWGVRVLLSDPEPHAATIRIVDGAGRVLRTFDSPAGTRVFEWDRRDSRGSAVGRGIHFIRIESGAGTILGTFFRSE